MNGESLENFNLTLQSLIKHNFNLNLVGINGCGKTKLVRDNFLEFFNSSGMYFTLTDFMDKEILLKKFHKLLRNLLTDKILRINSTLEIMANYFVKSFKFLRSRNFHLRFVNSLRTSKSDLENICSRLDNTAFKNFLHIYEFFTEFNGIWENLNKARNKNNEDNCLFNNKNECMNYYNQYIDNNLFPNRNPYIVIDGIDDIKYFFNTTSVVKYFNKLTTICISFNLKLLLISNFDLKTSELNFPQSEIALDFTEFVTLVFPKYNREDYIDILSQTSVSPNKNNLNSKLATEEIMKISVGNYIDSIANFNSYIYNIHEINEEYGKSPIKSIIRSQLATTYLKHDNTCINSFDNQKMNRVDYIEYIRNDNDLNRLSFCQKILLVSSFLASETDVTNDDKLFVNVKRTNFNKRHANKQKSFDIKRLKRGVNLFDVHRLLAIYSSIWGILNEGMLRVCNLNIELISDLNTLINYNLIKSLCGKINPDRNSFLDLNKKLRCNINIEFAMLLAGEIGIVLEDFVDFGYLNLG